MIKKALLVTAALVACGFVMYVRNPAPIVPAIPAEALETNSGKPFVVKLHAQWCPVCMVTKDVWSEIEDAYSGRVHLVVLDFTSQAKTDASRIEAMRLGLNEVFEDYQGVTGAILVVDGRTRNVTADISGNRDFADYRAAIDDALKEATR